ncbi:MAG: uroporphyrinogen-III C-methyltransferase [Planctomycetaceae bacterium]
MSGCVYLIGAGPGDPGLLTLRGAELLARADVVLYDGLSNPDILAHAPGATRICVGKHGQSRIWTQDEINAEMLRHARGGARVARLKGGDPAVFARTAEEAEALREAQIPFEIVPGITAALAAGSYAGIPITHRRYASAVALVTGHEEPGKLESSLDWNALAHFPGTLVIYMGVTTAHIWTSALISAGKSPDTPAAILRRCSLPDQQTIHCRLDEVAQRLTPPARLRPPVIVIIGEVTRLADTMAWFETRPLFGKTVLITRSEQQSSELSGPLSELGATIAEQPAIEIGPPESWREVDSLIQQIASYDYLVFSSRNGVESFFDRLLALGGDLRSLAPVKLAVVGKRTADKLAEYRLVPDIIPSEYTAAALAERLIPLAQGKRFASIRASRGPDNLAPLLQSAGGDVSHVVAYSHRDVAAADPSIVAAMSRGEIDWVTVTSAAIAKSLVRLFGDALGNTKLASLSPAITQLLAELGYRAAAEASEATMQSLVEAIHTAESSLSAFAMPTSHRD